MRPIEPADFFPCPICSGLMQDFFCTSCKAITVLPWTEVAHYNSGAVIGEGC